VIKNRDEFAGMMKNAFKEAKIKVPAALFKAILMALAERDETADICTDLPAPRPNTYWVYAIECADGSFYIGQTDNLSRRWTEHWRGKGAKWTAAHKPVRIVYFEDFPSREEAVKKERELKTGFGRKWLKKYAKSDASRQAGAKGNPEPDPELRDYENVPLKEDVGEYMKREVLPHVPDAWIDHSKTKIGYEINFNRYFYKYTPPRPLDEIEADLKKIEKDIAQMLMEVTQ